MKKINLLSLIGVLFLCSCSEDLAEYMEPEGLYAGYSFEAVPDEFNIYRGSNYDVEWTQEDAFDGAGSLKISSDDLDGSTFAFWNLRLYDLPVGKTISIRIKAKSQDLSGQGWTITMGTRSSDETLTEFVGIDQEGDTNDWEEFTLSLSDPIPEGVDFMDFYLLMLERTSGTIYFDKMEIIAE